MDINSLIQTHQNTILNMSIQQQIMFNPTVHSELCNLQIRLNQLKNKRDRIEDNKRNIFYV